MSYFSVIVTPFCHLEYSDRSENTSAPCQKPRNILMPSFPHLTCIVSTSNPSQPSQDAAGVGPVLTCITRWPMTVLLRQRTVARPHILSFWSAASSVFGLFKARWHMTRCTGFIDVNLTYYLDELFLKKQKKRDDIFFVNNISTTGIHTLKRLPLCRQMSQGS